MRRVIFFELISWFFSQLLLLDPFQPVHLHLNGWHLLERDDAPERITACSGVLRRTRVLLYTCKQQLNVGMPQEQQVLFWPGFLPVWSSYIDKFRSVDRAASLHGSTSFLFHSPRDSSGRPAVNWPLSPSCTPCLCEQFLPFDALCFMGVPCSPPHCSWFALEVFVLWHFFRFCLVFVETRVCWIS